MRASEHVAPVAAVTGGRRGIGRAICHSLAKAGFDVIAIDAVDDAELARTVSQVQDLGARAKSLVLDVAAVDEHEGNAGRMFAAFGHLDCLVNNAGVIVANRGQDLLQASVRDFDFTMNVNLRGTFFLTQAVARRMVQTPPSGNATRSIITISSGASGRAKNDAPEYAFSKTCVSLMSEMFALRLGGENIRTFDVRPGIIRTDMSRDVWDSYERMASAGLIPLPRLGDPEDVGDTVAALAGGALRYTTGQTVHVGGGMQIPRSPARPE